MNKPKKLFTSFCRVILIFSAGLFLSSCEYWHEPVREYLERWTKEVAIERFELEGIESYSDKNGNLCISSDQAAAVRLVMINPHHYDNISVASSQIITGASGAFPSIVQDPDDPTLLHFTYSSGFLEANDCGGDIGATITINHPLNGTSNDFTFELKCNSKPPSIKGQNIQVSGNKYYICFYIPTDELNSNRHRGNTHTIYINGQAVASGNATELADASAERPSVLDSLTGYPTFSGTLPGCTPFYYNTNSPVNTGDNLEWSVYLEDNDGLVSKTVTASTIVAPATVTLSGNDLLDLTDEGETSTLMAEIDEGEVRNWSWTSSDEEIISVARNPDGSSATITASKGGTADITATAELTDGRIFSSTKTIRVLDLEFAQNSPEDFLKGQTDIPLSVDAPGFPGTPTLTWDTDNHSIATVDSTGKIRALAKGSTSVTVNASYGGKTVSETKELFVHELSISGGSELFVGGSPLTLSADVSSPTGRTRPQNLSLTWYSVNSATVASVDEGRVTAIGEGHSAIFVDATLNGNRLDYAAFTTVYVYDLSIEVNPPSSKNNLNSSTTTDGKAVYALPKLSDAFTFEVTNQGSFPSGTSYTWIINGTTLTGTEQKGPSVTVAPNSMLGTVGKSPSSKSNWTVSCKATLPSGLGSPNIEKVSYIYNLVIPEMKVTIETAPSLPKTGERYHVNSDDAGDANNKFKIKVERTNSQDYLPQGLSYRWKINSTDYAAGNDRTNIEQTIKQLRNNTTTAPSSFEAKTVSCTVSLTNCNSKTPSTTIQFAPPKAFDSEVKINLEQNGPSVDDGSYFPGDLDSNGYYIVKYWNDYYTYFLFDICHSSLPNTCHFEWKAQHSGREGEDIDYFNITLPEMLNLSSPPPNPSTQQFVHTDTIECKLKAPGYATTTFTFPIKMKWSGT